MANRTSKGQFAPGGESANPEGRRVTKASTSAPGYDGQVAFGGYLDNNESDSDLRGTRRWTTFANMYRRPPVAVWGRLRSSLLAGVSWTATENEAGGKDAARGKEIVEKGLLTARFGTGVNAKPFSAVAAKAMNGAAAVGHSVHAIAVGRRKDGMVVFTDIAHRPQHTIERWLREIQDDESTPFVAVEQRTKTNRTKVIDLDECLYVVNDNGTQSDSPAGVGMLELIAERVRRLGVYEPLEGSEFASSMGGIPVTRAPLSEMRASLRSKISGTATEIAAQLDAAITSKLRPFRDFVAKRYKDPSKLSWFELDSATYKGVDPNTISGIKKWDIEIIKGDMQGAADIRKAISDYDLDVARVLGVELVWMGGGDTTGTYGAHESKIGALGASLNAEVGLFAFVAQQQLARYLCVRNGLDPDTACPTLVPSPVMRTDVIKAVDAITKLNMAGLPPNHPAKKAVFEGVDLPWQEEDEKELMLPRGLLPQPASLFKPASTAPTDTTTKPGEEQQPVPDATNDGTEQAKEPV